MNAAKKALVDKLKPLLAAKRFTWRASRRLFLRTEPHGFVSLVWASYSSAAGGWRQVLTPVLDVRHDVVEDVVNQLGLVYGADNQKYTATVGRPLNYFPFTAGTDCTQYIRFDSIEADATAAAAQVVAMLEGGGEAFFARYASLLECSKGLNDPIESVSHPLCNNFPLRACYGVATAYMAERERVPDLIRQYLAFSATALPAEHETLSKRLQQLVAILKSTG